MFNDAELWFREAVIRRHSGNPAGAERCWRRILGLRRPEAFCSIDQGIYGHLTRRNLAALATEKLGKLGGPAAYGRGCGTRRSCLIGARLRVGGLRDTLAGASCLYRIRLRQSDLHQGKATQSVARLQVARTIALTGIPLARMTWTIATSVPGAPTTVTILVTLNLSLHQ